METNVTKKLGFPGWAQQLGAGSIANRVRDQFRIYPQFWLQSIRRKTVTITINRYQDSASRYIRQYVVNPDNIRNFILNNSDRYTDLVINFVHFDNSIRWGYGGSPKDKMNLNGITVRTMTINQNGMPTQSHSSTGLGSYELFQNISTIVQTNYN